MTLVSEYGKICITNKKSVLRQRRVFMHEHLVNFIENLMTYYQNRDDITYVTCDGSAEPVEVKCLSMCAMDVEERIDEIISWLNCYLIETEKVSFYHLYKHLMQDLQDIWVNPSLHELRQFNTEQGLPYTKNLEERPNYEQVWADQLLGEMEAALAEHGYAIVSGHELIDHYINVYDEHMAEDITLSEWIDSSYIEEIDTDSRYLYDLEVDTMPVLIEKDFIFSYASQDLRVPNELLSVYFDELLVTRRGIESNKVIEDRLFGINCYHNLRHYLKVQPFETKESSLRKLFRDSVDPTLPFVEVVMDGLGEIYINHVDLQTEKDILDFINLAYQVEEIDLEAKTFNRKNILLSIMDEVITEDVLNNNKPIRYTLGNK